MLRCEIPPSPFSFSCPSSLLPFFSNLKERFEKYHRSFCEDAYKTQKGWGRARRELRRERGEYNGDDDSTTWRTKRQRTEKLNQRLYASQNSEVNQREPGAVFPANTIKRRIDLRWATDDCCSTEVHGFKIKWTWLSYGYKRWTAA